MISAWNLFWIIPVSVLCGVFYAALCSAAGNRDKYGGKDDARHR